MVAPPLPYEAPSRGRPSDYSADIAEAICAGLAEGKTLRAVCRAAGMPSEVTVRRWALEDREGFSAQYGKAREIGYQRMADEILEIADDSSCDSIVDGETGAERINSEFVARSRLKVDTRKWLLSKALPKIYGDKITQEHQGAGGGPVLFQTIYEPASN